MIDYSMVEPYISPMAPEPTHLSPKGKLGKPLLALLCDIYGTLFISGSGDLSLAKQQHTHPKTVDQVLSEYGLEMPSAVLIQSLYRAIRSAHQDANANGIDHPEIQVDRIWSKLLPFKSSEKVRSFAVEFEMVMNPVWPMPGLREMIQTCCHQGIRLGIISNAQFYTAYLFEWFLKKDLQTLGFDPDLIFYSYQYGRAKPSRYLYQLAAKRLHQMGISTGRAAYIGNDMRNDILPAREVGFQTVLFAGDARSLRMREDEPGCQNVVPDLRITHLHQLTRYMTTA